MIDRRPTITRRDTLRIAGGAAAVAGFAGVAGGQSDDGGGDHGSLGEGLVAYYPADDPADSETATDEAGDHDAPLSEGVSYRESGQVGSNCLSFDGEGGYAEAPGVGPEIDEANAFTIAYWVSFHDLKWYRVPYGSEPANFYTEPYRNDTAGVTIVLEDEAGQPYKLRTGTLLESEDVWYHVAYTWDGEELVAYLDGELDGTRPTVGPTIATGDPHQIGRWGESGFYLDGLMDDIRIYERALSADEVQRLANLEESTDLSD